VQGNQDQDFRI